MEFLDSSVKEYTPVMRVDGSEVELRLEGFGLYGKNCRGVILLELPLERLADYQKSKWAQGLAMHEFPEFFEGKAKKMVERGSAMGRRVAGHVVAKRAKAIGKGLKRRYRLPSIANAVMEIDPEEGSLICSYFKGLECCGLPVEEVYRCSFAYKKNYQAMEPEKRKCFFDGAHNVARGILDSFWKECRGRVEEDELGRKEYSVRGRKVDVDFMLSGELEKAKKILERH